MSKVKEEDFEHKLASFHPKFLRIIRRVYPLAVLGSLCVAISAFAHQSYPEAQAYALASASLFLTAFVLSFSYEIFKFTLAALMSYISTALAVFLLFLAIFEFSVSVPMISRTFPSIMGFLAVIFFTSLYYSMFKVIRRVKSKLSRASAWISISCGVLTLSLMVINQISFLLSGEYVAFAIDLFPKLIVSFLAVSLAFSVVAIYLIRKEVKKEKSSAKQQ
jgi:hypothetical protein